MFISPYDENAFICNHCDLRKDVHWLSPVENVHWLSYVGSCKFSRATLLSIDRYKAVPVNGSTALHYYLKSIVKQHLYSFKMQF